MGESDMPELAGLIAAGLDLAVEPAAVAAEVGTWRKQFTGVHFTADDQTD